MRSRKVVPIASDDQGLSLAMCDPDDELTRDAIHRITGLKVLPRLALEEDFDYFINRYLRPGGETFREQTGA